jgi:surfeit locus 1 family protein
VTTVFEREMAAGRHEEKQVVEKVGRGRVGQLGNPTSLLKTVLVGLILLFSVIALSGLGVWQVQRRVWKLDLIDRVEQRVRATPTDAPGPASWPIINAPDYAYRHVSVRGRFLQGKATLVRAVTERGRGYWLVEPFQTAEGFTVLINRGFIPADRTTRRPPGREQPVATITGLLRMTESSSGECRLVSVRSIAV